MKAEFNIPGGRTPDDHANFLAANEYADFREFLRDHYDDGTFDYDNCMNDFWLWQEQGCPSPFKPTT